MIYSTNLNPMDWNDLTPAMAHTFFGNLRRRCGDLGWKEGDSIPIMVPLNTPKWFKAIGLRWNFDFTLNQGHS